MTEVWAEQRDRITFHDPLAAAVVFEPDLCGLERGRVEVELKSDRVPGMTHLKAGGEDAPHAVAVEVDPERFFEHCFSVTSRRPD